MKLSTLLAIAALAAAASAQSVTVPLGMASTNPGTSTLAWRNTLFHHQMLYDETNFLAQGINYPILITRLQYRAGANVTSPGGETYTGLTVQMSSSPSDWTSPSTTFATNVGADVTTVFTGTVTCVAAAGNPSPNTQIIDITLTTPFAYDPTSGLDLMIDVNAPTAPAPATLPTMACSSNAAHLARRVSTATAAATTGSTSYFASVVLMDYTPIPNAATATAYGTGCVAKAQSFYETFAPGALDLQGTVGNPNSVKMTPLGGGYLVAPGSNGWFTPTSFPITLADDALTTPLNMPFVFNYPGGSTSDILICSNGFVYLDILQTSTSAVGTGAGLLTFGPRIAPMWNDLDPSVGGTVSFDVDPSNTAVYVTWDQVPLYGLPAQLNTMQLAIYSDGGFEYRYQVCQNAQGVAGWSPGNGARDPGDLDISAAMPFLTDVDTYPLALAASNRPKLGGTLNLEVTDFPVGAGIGAIALGFTLYPAPGIDLASIGAPTCFQLSSFDGIFGFDVTGPTKSLPLSIPVDPALAGFHVYGQAVSTAPTSNNLGVVTSGGLDLLLDIN